MQKSRFHVQNYQNAIVGSMRNQVSFIVCPLFRIFYLINLIVSYQQLFDKNARKTGVLFVPEYEVMFQPSSCCPRPCCPCCPCCPQPAGSRLILKLGTSTSTSTSTQQYIAAAPGTDGGLLLKAVNDPADKDTKFVLSPLI